MEFENENSTPQSQPCFQNQQFFTPDNSYHYYSVPTNTLQSQMQQQNQYFQTTIFMNPQQPNQQFLQNQQNQQLPLFQQFQQFPTQDSIPTPQFIQSQSQNGLLFSQPLNIQTQQYFQQQQQSNQQEEDQDYQPSEESSSSNEEQDNEQDSVENLDDIDDKDFDLQAYLKVRDQL